MVCISFAVKLSVLSICKVSNLWLHRSLWTGGKNSSLHLASSLSCFIFEKFANLKSSKDISPDLGTCQHLSFCDGEKSAFVDIHQIHTSSHTHVLVCFRKAMISYGYMDSTVLQYWWKSHFGSLSRVKIRFSLLPPWKVVAAEPILQHLGQELTGEWHQWHQWNK